MKLKFCFLLFVSIASYHLLAQKNNSNAEKQIGFMVSSIVPTSYFGAAALYIDEEHSSLELSTKIGYQFGMVLKTRFSDKFSIEKGISFCRRNYNIYGNPFIKEKQKILPILATLITGYLLKE